MKRTLQILALVLTFGSLGVAAGTDQSAAGVAFFYDQ